MNIQQWPPMLVQAITAALVLAGFIIASWLLSYIRASLGALLEETRTHFRETRQRLMHSGRDLARQLTDHVRDRISLEPVKPIAFALRQLVDATAHPGRVEVEQLRALEARFGENVAKLDKLVPMVGTTANVDVEGLQNNSATRRGGMLMLFVLLTLTIVVMVVNTFILMEFFRAVFPSRPLLPYPLPAIELGHVLALLFAIVEVAAGMAIHAFAGPGSGSAYVEFFRWVPAIVIAALAVIEWFAYALLSANINMPARLGIETSSAFYGIARYFLAPFGPVLSMLLAALGYALWDKAALVFRGRNDARILKAFRRFVQHLQQFQTQISVTEKSLATLQEKARSFEPQLADSYHKGVIEAGDRADPAVDIRSTAAVLLSRSGQEPARRTPEEYWAAMGLDLLLTAVWFGLTYILYRLYAFVFAEWLPMTQEALARLLALALALIVALLGFLIKEGAGRGAYASPVNSELPASTPRRGFTYLAALVLLMVAVLTSWVGMQAQSLGDASVVNALFGATVVLGTAIVAFRLDSGLVSVLRASQLLAGLLLRLVVLLYSAVSVLIEFLLYLSGQIVKLISIPGDRIRRPRTMRGTVVGVSMQEVSK
jgi:hypothetical protein